MAKKQTRRSISVRGTTYERLRTWCEGRSLSMSEFIEARIAEHLGAESGTTARTQSAPLPSSRPLQARPLPSESEIAARLSPRPALRVTAPAPRPAPAPAPRPAVAAVPRFSERPAMVSAPRHATPVTMAPPRLVEAPRPVAPITPINRPVEVARPIRVATPPEPTARSAGRPAPTPAGKVLKVIDPEMGSDGSDYRAIRF